MKVIIILSSTEIVIVSVQPHTQKKNKTTSKHKQVVNTLSRVRSLVGVLRDVRV